MGDEDLWYELQGDALSHGFIEDDDAFFASNQIRERFQELVQIDQRKRDECTDRLGRRWVLLMNKGTERDKSGRLVGGRIDVRDLRPADFHALYEDDEAGEHAMQTEAAYIAGTIYRAWTCA